MNTITTLAGTLLLGIPLLTSGPAGAGDTQSAVVKTMMVRMSKNPEAGIRRAIMQGMRNDISGIDTPYVDLDSNGGCLRMKKMQRMLIILPAWNAEGETWSTLEIENPPILSLSLDEAVAHPKLGSPDGIPARRYFEIRADAPGESAITVLLKAEKPPVEGLTSFKMRVVVE